MAFLKPKPTPANDAPVNEIEGERHVSEVAGTSNPMVKKAGLAAFLLAGGALAVFAALSGPHKKDDDQTAKREDKVEVASAVGYKAPPLPNGQPPIDAPPEDVPPLPPNAATPGGPDGQIQLTGTTTSSGGTASGATRPPVSSRLVVYQGNIARVGQSVREAASNSGYGPGDTGQDGAAGAASELGARLLPTSSTAGVRASLLRNQPYLLTAGTMVPCILQTAMDSTLPGFVTCVVPQDIVGKTGLTLLDRGTRVVGEFQGGVQRGRSRMFVLWTRAETPQGVVINLNSPAADAIGRSGLGGAVDNRFWERFGSALLLSTVDAALQAAVTAQSKEGQTTVNTGQANRVVDSILQDSINIPPVVRKNQGELVSIMVKQDLDFSSVYGLAPAQPRYTGAGR